MDDIPRPTPPSPTNSHPKRDQPHMHNIETSTSATSTTSSVYPTPPSTAIPSSDDHDHSVVPPPAQLSSAQTHPLTTSEILKHLLPFLVPVPIPIRWDLGDDAALRDMFVRLLGDPALFALHRSGDSGADAGESFALGKAKGKVEERAKSIGAEKRSGAGGKVVEDEKDADKSSQGRGEHGEGKGQRRDQAQPVVVDMSDADVIMHDEPPVSVPSSSSSHLETPPKHTHGHSSMSKSWSSTRKPGHSKEKTTFSPVDWSKFEPKTKEESSRGGARVISLSLSPNAKLILTPPSAKGSGSAVAAKTRVGSPSTSLHAAGSVSPVPFLKSRSSSSLSFNDQSPSRMTRSYTLPPQAEGSIAALREVALGTVFPDSVIFGVNKNAGGSGEMDLDAAGDKSHWERKNRSEAEALREEEEEGEGDVAHNADTAREDEEEAQVMEEEEPTDDESMPISIRVQDDGDNEVGTPRPMSVQKSLADVGRTHSGVSSSSLSTLTSLASSTGISRSESPQNSVPDAISNASESESGLTRKLTWRSSVLPATTSTSAPSPYNVIDFINVKFGPPKKKSVSRPLMSPSKSSLNQAASHPSSKRLTPTVSTTIPARQIEQLPQSQTPLVSSQSSQATVDEESIAQDLIMTASSQPVPVEQEDIDQFSSLARPSPSKKVAGGYADDDISMGTSVGSGAVGVDSQSQIESASEATPKRQRMIRDEVEAHNDTADRVGADPIPLSCSPQALKTKGNETVSPPPQLASTSSPLFTSPPPSFQQPHADDFAPMEDVDDDLQPPSIVQSRLTEKSPSHSPSQPVVLLSGVSDMTTKIVQVKRELNSSVPTAFEEVLPSNSPRAKRPKLTPQSSSSQPANRHVDNKGKGKNVAKKSAADDDVISISSDSDVVVVNPGKETKKKTPTPTNPSSSQQNSHIRPIPLKRKPAKKLNVFEKPPPEVVDLTTPVKAAPKTKPAEKGKAKAASPPPSPLAGPSSSVKRTRSSRMLVDNEEGPSTRAALGDVAEPEPGPDQSQAQEPEQKRKRRAAPVKAKPAIPTPIRKYTARLAAEAEDSDDADIISVKRQPTKKPGSSTGGVGIAVKRDPDAEAAPLDAAGGGAKMGFMGKLAGKSGKSGAKTRVKKRKRTPNAQDSSDEDDEDDEEFSLPPLKRVKARNGSAVPATSSTADKGKGKESGSKPLSRAETESVQAKEEETDVGTRYTFRSPRKEPSLGGISAASVSTPKKKRAQPAVWPKIENPNFDLFVSCDLCKKWYHIGCVGVGPEDVRLRETETYHCPLCDSDVPKEESPIKKTPGQEDVSEPKHRCQRRNCLRPTTKKHRGRKSQAEIAAIKQLEETFDVEAFVGRHKKVVGGQGVMYEYLVKWLNYPYAEATWETLANMGLANPVTLLEQFEQASADEGIDLDNSGNVVFLKAAVEAGWTEDRVFVKPAA